MGLLSFILGSDNKRSLKKLEKIATKVEALSDVYASKSDEELAKTTLVLKERLNAGETLNDILPDAYALVREASTRVLGKRHFHVQILGGIALHQGRIAQMRTGEGKTLCATLPAYLNSLTGKGVHVVTVNEYLAKTQAEEMSKLYNFLGVSVGCKAYGQTFLQLETLMIIGLGLIAFSFGTIGGLFTGRIMCKLSGGKINPLIGSAGVSAVPMAARISEDVGRESDPNNHLLMHAMGPNVAGVIGSAIAAGFLLSLF